MPIAWTHKNVIPAIPASSPFILPYQGNSCSPSRLSMIGVLRLFRVRKEEMICILIKSGHNDCASMASSNTLSSLMYTWRHIYADIPSLH